MEVDEKKVVFMRKILYSPGYGAGWTSWEGNLELKKFMLEYAPLVEYLENGGDPKDLFKKKKNGTFLPELIKYKDNEAVSFNEDVAKKNLHPVAFQFVKECWDKFKSIPYLGGMAQLEVENIDGLCRIEEYDGYESVHVCYDDWM